MRALLMEHRQDEICLALLEDRKLMDFRAVAETGLRTEAVLIGRVRQNVKGVAAAFVSLPDKQVGFLPESEAKQPLHPGDFVLVQVKKPAVGAKSAYLTQDISLAGRGLILLPLIAILLLNLAGTIQRRKQVSRRTFFSFLIAIVPIMAAMFALLFIDVFPLIDIAYVLTALSMYGFALSEQIEQDRRHQLEIANQRASVMVLQMRPHFIYNTLMSIYCLCDQDPQKARQVTMDFTNYLRRNFNAVASDSTIPFSAELEHTRAYLAVEQAQFEDMLLVEYDTPVTNFRLPPLTLQPLVENSVKHGMNPYSGPLHVSVRTRRPEAGIEVIVEDNGPGFDPDDESKPHTTLANIRQRMEMMCGGSLAIRPRDGGGTVATVTIPDRQEQADPRQTS